MLTLTALKAGSCEKPPRGSEKTLRVWNMTSLVHALIRMTNLHTLTQMTAPRVYCTSLLNLTIIGAQMRVFPRHIRPLHNRQKYLSRQPGLLKTFLGDKSRYLFLIINLAFLNSSRREKERKTYSNYQPGVDKGKLLSNDIKVRNSKKNNSQDFTQL